MVNMAGVSSGEITERDIDFSGRNNSAIYPGSHNLKHLQNKHPRFPQPSIRGFPAHGFTLIELMMVLTVISILVSIAIPIASSAILRAKEGVLKSNLHTLRTLIDQYTADKHKAPQALEDLVSAGYLRSIPKDPVTNSNSTWQIVMEDASLYPDQTETGIFDVKSGSNAISTEGTPYSDW